MTFAHPAILWLAVVPFGLLVLDVSIRGASTSWPRIRRLWAGAGGFSDSSGPDQRRRWRLWLGLMLVIVAGARPQWGRIEEQTFDQSREVLIALDLSRSMLAEDVKPSRLDRGKLLIESLLDRLRGERVGLILFSGTAFLQSPLSPDYEVLREFLPALNPEYLPEGGTDFDRLLSVSLDSFSNEGGADRFLIVLSDGESQTDTWRQRIERVTQRKIRIITLGIGTEAGAVMPDKGGGFVKDERGAVVLSRLEPGTLRDLARMTGGSYANAAAWVDLPQLLEQTVERGRQGEFVQRSELRLVERYQWFLAAGLLMLGLSFWREFPVRPRVRDLKMRGAAAGCLLLAFAFPAADMRAGSGELPQLAGSLSQQPALSASDASRFANATIEFGKERRGAGAEIPPTVLHDGFASVTLGEGLDRNAADWPELRRQLEELARPPEQQKQEQQQQEEQKKEQEKKENQEQNKERQDPNQQEQEEQQQQQEKNQEKKDQEQKDQNKSGQKAFDEPPSEPSEPQPQDEKPQSPKNMQSVGGEPAKDQELLENPELAVPLQKLDRVKQQDSPARLFQLLQTDEPKRRDKKERDW